MTHTVQRWGNSLALRIPRRLAQSAGLSERSPVEVRREGRCIVIEPLPSPLTLESLPAGSPIVWWARWTPGCGDVVSVRADGEPQRWTALVVSPVAYTAGTGCALVRPVSERVRGGPFEAAVPASSLGPVVVLADRVRCLGVRDSGMRLLSRTSDAVVCAVRERLVAVLAG